MELPQVRVPPHAVAGEYEPEDVFDALSLLTNAPFNLYSSFEERDELVPESAAEVELLDATFGTRDVSGRLSATVQGRTFHEPVTPDLVAAILPKRAGTRLYAEALRVGTAQARYRDFWRILESAFATTDRRLLELVASCPPLQEMGVTLGELNKLSWPRTQRGRRADVVLVGSAAPPLEVLWRLSELHRQFLEAPGAAERQELREEFLHLSKRDLYSMLERYCDPRAVDIEAPSSRPRAGSEPGERVRTEAPRG